MHHANDAAQVFRRFSLFSGLVLSLALAVNHRAMHGGLLGRDRARRHANHPSQT